MIQRTPAQTKFDLEFLPRKRKQDIGEKGKVSGGNIISPVTRSHKSNRRRQGIDPSYHGYLMRD